MSEDNGKTYSADIYSIPPNRDIFLKYEISAGANFPRYLFPGMLKCFDLVMDEDTFEPCDYSGVYDTDGISYRINALANRKKVNITLKLPSVKNTKAHYRLDIEFEPEILQIYNKTTVLYAAGSQNYDYSPQPTIVCNNNVYVRTERRRGFRLWAAVKKMTNAKRKKRKGHGCGDGARR